MHTVTGGIAARYASTLSKPAATKSGTSRLVDSAPVSATPT